MLNNISLQNFRSFKDASIDCAPITILAGANSSGKSSVLQALNGVLQSTGERGFPFDFVLNGELTQLGAFRNVVHGHNAKNSFGVKIDFSFDQKRYVASGTYKNSSESRHLFFRNVTAEAEGVGSLSVEWNQKAQRFSVWINPRESFVQERAPNWISAFMELVRTDASGALAEVISDATEEPSIQVGKVRRLFETRMGELRNGVRIKATDIDSAIKEFERLPLFTTIKGAIYSGLDRLRKEVSYIGPVRAYPSRYYLLAKQKHIVDPVGDHLSHMLATWKDRRSSRFNDVKQALVRLDLATELSAETELGEFLKVSVKPRQGSLPDTLADVGFGVSQVLPALVADAALDDGGTLLINQPEIHLHPSSQALLGDLFASRIDRRRYVIETHSEYLITRLRLLIAKGLISEDDVAIYYFSASPEGGSSIVTRVTAKKDGSLLGMPKDFFTTYAADTFGLAMAAMEGSEEEDAEE